MEGGCSFADKDEIPCGGHPVFFPRKAGRGAFIGCSNWQPGDPLTSKGGHMFRCIRPGVDPDLIKTWMENGIEDVASSDSCSYISGKRFKELTCNRHGGENPRLKRSGGGECPVRVEFLSPVGSTGDTVRVFVIWRGTHSHVFPVCKPSSRLVQDVVQENPSASIRALQVLLLSSLLLFLGLLVWPESLSLWRILLTREYNFFFLPAFVFSLQATISDASGGGQASTSFVRKLRHSARSTTHPFGQDLLGVMDLYRRSGYRHDYVKAIIQRPAYTAVVLQPEKQADMAGQMRFIEADSAFGVVTRGTAKDGVQAEAISEAGKQAFDWHQFSIMYVRRALGNGGKTQGCFSTLSACSALRDRCIENDIILILSDVVRRSLVPWLNRAVTLLRAMVIGKTASMYEDLFEYYFSTAAEHGLAGPGGRVAVRAGGGTSSRRTPFVAATMEFETAQHTGYARGLCHVFGGEAADYTGRVIGCAVHFKRFLLGPSGNSLDDPFFVSMMRLRDADSVGGEGDVRERLTSMAAEYRKSSQPKKVNVIQWLLKNPAAFSAAFPKSSGRLNKFELLARPDNTNACESLNRQKKQVVSDARATTLLEVIAALSDFDGRTMAAITSNGRGTPSGVSQVARMNRAAKRKRKSNVVPSSGQPPKAAMRRGTGTNPPQGATAADPHSVAVRDAARGAGAAAGVAPTVRGKTPSATTGEGVARAPPLWQSSPELMAEFELFLAARQQKRTAGADGGASK